MTFSTPTPPPTPENTQPPELTPEPTPDDFAVLYECYTEGFLSDVTLEPGPEAELWNFILEDESLFTYTMKDLVETDEDYAQLFAALVLMCRSGVE